MNFHDNKYFETILLVFAFLVFVSILYVTGFFYSPILLYITALLLLLPYRQNKPVRTLISVTSLLLILWFLNSVISLLIPFIISFLLSYMLNPLVERLSRKKISRALSSILIILGFILLIITLMIFLAPAIIKQFSELLTSLPQALNDVNFWFNTVLLPWLNGLGIPTQNLEEKIINSLPGKTEEIFSKLLMSLSAIFSGLSVILNQIVNLILIPFLTFYILKDFDKIKALVKSLLPQNNLLRYVYFYNRIDDLMGSFLRGSILAAVIHGVVVFIFLSIIGVKYAIFLSAFSALLNLIPYFGLLLSVILSSIIAFFSGNPAMQVPLTILFYLLQNLLETSFIVPKIVGEKVGLHPALLILSLLIFSYFFGFIGLLIAMPVTSVCIMFFKEWLDNRKLI